MQSPSSSRLTGKGDQEDDTPSATATFRVEGMTCGACVEVSDVLVAARRVQKLRTELTSASTSSC